MTIPDADAESHMHAGGSAPSHAHGHDHGHSHEPGHEHGHAHSHAPSRKADRRALWIAFGITLTFTVIETAGGWISGSLALLADAGHMFTDAGALGMSLVAIWLAGRPAAQRRTYGLYRAEILAAFFNGVTLFVVCGWIFYEAYQRFLDPPQVQSRQMLLIAVAGMFANAASFYVLWRSGGESLNLRGALLHVLGDLLGSVGAIGAALLMMFTGWQQADPVISVVIALLIVVSAWRLLHETLRVLLEMAPLHIDPQEVENALANLPGVQEVHDVHVWTITSGVEAVSGHLRLTDDDLNAGRLEDLFQQAYLALRKFHIEHVTLQIEPFHHKDPPTQI